MTATTTTSTDKLVTLTQNLPPELFGMVAESTFTVDKSSTNVVISSGYRPPSTLAVHPDLRDSMAQTYYDNSSFHSTDWDLCVRWLLSLSPEHLSLLRVISCDFEDVGPNMIDSHVQEVNLLRALLAFCEVQDRMEEEEGLFFGPGTVFRICSEGKMIREYPAFPGDGLPTVTEMMARK